jgi:hypothetical protein
MEEMAIFSVLRKLSNVLSCYFTCYIETCHEARPFLGERLLQGSLEGRTYVLLRHFCT